MIGYATVTGTLRNMAALRAAGWGTLYSAAGWLPSHDWVGEKGIPECIGDSGAWHHHSQGTPFNNVNYERLLVWIRPLKPRFVMLPDIVGAGSQSLDLSLHWLPIVRLAGLTPALVVQDGMLPDHVRNLIGPQLALCIGGSTEWKLQTLGTWCKLARERGAWSHVLRVNTGRRIRLCERAGADGFDGTSASKFVNTLPMLDRERRTQDIEGYLARNTAA